MNDNRLTVREVELFYNWKTPQVSGNLSVPKSYSTVDDFPIAYFPKSEQDARAQQEKLRNATLATAAGKQQEAKLEPGKNYGLFFATDKYDDSSFETLNNPIADASAIAETLKKYYGYDTLVVQNPMLKEILQTIRVYKEKSYKNADHLFLFFCWARHFR